MYDVYAIDDPSKACDVLIGSLVLKTGFTTSKFGDEKLFFRHNLMETDLKEHAPWTPFTATWSFLGWDIDSE